MRVMTAGEDLDADTVGRRAGLTGDDLVRFRNGVASWAMEGQVATVEELQAGAELAAGRIDFAGYRRRLGV